MERNYKVNQTLLHPIRLFNDVQSAIDILNSRRRLKRPSMELGSEMPRLGCMPDEKITPDLKGIPSIAGMRQWLHHIGHSVRVFLNNF